MDYKFIQPVSMQVTQEQYERDLREPLLKIGYEEVCFTDLDKLNILITSENGLVSNSNEKAVLFVVATLSITIIQNFSLPLQR